MKNVYIMAGEWDWKKTEKLDSLEWSSNWGGRDGVDKFGKWKLINLTECDDSPDTHFRDCQ